MRVDMTGQRFGKLVVVSYAYSNPNAHWHCLCDCGKRAIVSRPNLMSGSNVSCGCVRAANRIAAGKANRTHGHSGYSPSREYKSWQAMHQRCSNPSATSFKWYGGRGIKVCKRWSRFENFLADMGPRPPKTVIDRINPNGDYKPSNCRWGKTGRTKSRK